eukprot:13008702-Alexandrium_andersonii.AAC.1
MRRWRGGCSKRATRVRKRFLGRTMDTRSLPLPLSETRPETLRAIQDERSGPLADASYAS